MSISSKKSKYDAVCYPGTTYALLLYLLIEPHKIEKTFFIADDRIPQNIANYLHHYRYKNISSYNNSNIFFSIIRDNYKYLLYDYIWVKNGLKGKPIYAMDHIGSAGASMSRYLLHRRENFTLLEDGVGNYNMPQKQTIIPIEKGIKSKLKGTLKQKYFPLWGTSDRISEIFLTGIDKIPDIIKNKVKLFDLQDLWNKTRDKEQIKKIFNVDNLKHINGNKTLLLTQPLYKDIDKHIAFYKELVKDIPEKDLIIKPHPATANIDYKKYFPNAFCLNEIAYTPVELLFLIGLKIDKVISICCSASNFLNRYTIVETHYELLDEKSIL